MTLAEYLRTEKITQRQFAGQVGVSASYMNEIVQGVKTPGMQIAARIEGLTNGAVPMSALIVTANPPPAPAGQDTAPTFTPTQQEDAA